MKLNKLIQHYGFVVILQKQYFYNRLYFKYHDWNKTIFITKFSLIQTILAELN